MSAIAQHAAEPRQPRKRRWWVYALVAVGGLVVLAVAAFLALAWYYHSLIRQYTTLQPQALAEVSARPEDVDALKMKWYQFFQNVTSGQPVAPFKLSVDDLQLFISSVPNIKDRVRLNIADGRIQVLFSVPLDQANKRELKGRYLSGSAWLDIQLQEDGYPTLKLVSLQANGKAAPGWVSSKLRSKNLFEDLHRNPQLTDFLNGIEQVAVVGDQVIITPVNAR